MFNSFNEALIAIQRLKDGAMLISTRSPAVYTYKDGGSGGGRSEEARYKEGVMTFTGNTPFDDFFLAVSKECKQQEPSVEQGVELFREIVIDADNDKSIDDAVRAKVSRLILETVPEEQWQFFSQREEWVLPIGKEIDHDSLAWRTL